MTPRSKTASTGASKTKKPLDLALQGGGSHGAFTWGVLDYLLEQHEQLHLEGICGTSAGAVNGSVMAYGMMMGGPDAARELLHKFWKRIADISANSAFKPSPWDKAFGGGNMDYSPGFWFIQMLMEFSSPYFFNPTNKNLLREVLLEFIDFDKLRSCKTTKLFVCATNVRRGKLRVFKLPEISVEAVQASACLPYIFPAVTIDGEDYWDGGFMGNPPLFPLIDGTDSRDILIVQINPINIKETPTTASEIMDRVNELSFNSSLMLEMRRIEFVQRLLDRGIDLDGKLKSLRIHTINPEEHIAPLNLSSKLNTDWDYLWELHTLGRNYAEKWLSAHYDDIGVRSSVNVREVYM